MSRSAGALAADVAACRSHRASSTRAAAGGRKVPKPGRCHGGWFVPVRQPRVNDKRTDPITVSVSGSLAIGRPWSMKARLVAEVLPAVSAWPVQLVSGRFCAVPRLRCRPVGGDDHPADDAVARRGAGVQRSVAGGLGLCLRVGRRHPSEGSVGG